MFLKIPGADADPVDREDLRPAAGRDRQQEGAVPMLDPKWSARVGPVMLLVAFMAAGAVPHPAGGQEAAGTLPADSVPRGDASSPAAAIAPPRRHLPVMAVLGMGYGRRSDDCTLCASPEDNKSFTAHVSLVRPLGKGFGVGLDASVWRKGRPGTPTAPDSTGATRATSLANTLGNLSLSFSYDLWRLYFRAGGGLAWGSQDLEMDGPGETPLIHTASGWGVGYSAGAGITVPVASLVSLAIFANWNVGHYDLISPQGLTERAAAHEYLELGAGLAVR